MAGLHRVARGRELSTGSCVGSRPSNSTPIHVPQTRFAQRRVALDRRPRLVYAETGTARRPGGPLRPHVSEGAINAPLSEEAMPLFVALDKDVMESPTSLAYPEALSAGLKALRVLGVSGVSVDLHWGLVEGPEPGEYTWSGYRQLLKLISDYGFKINVSLCFNSTPTVPLPKWIVQEGIANPDIYYTDKAGGRSYEYLTMGINDVPVLRGRTAIDLYMAFMRSFKDEFGPWFGNTITEVLIGLGPNCELKYPAHPLDKRWNFPGIGEFQCYDKFMLATLQACADQVAQPSWGLGGPHDAGSYCLWPHQTGFFHQHGSWSTPYGNFFLQWYSEMLTRHAEEVLLVAKDVFGRLPIRMAVRIPGAHWWNNTASHAPELTSGYYNTASRDGYLPIFKALSEHNVRLRLSLAEMRTHEQPPQAFCNPESLLAQQLTVAASQQLPVTVENQLMRFDEPALSRMESVLFEPVQSHAIEVPPPAGLTFHCITDEMFEPNNWRAFKAFVIRVRERAEREHGKQTAAGSKESSKDEAIFT